MLNPVYFLQLHIREVPSDRKILREKTELEIGLGVRISSGIDIRDGWEEINSSHAYVIFDHVSARGTSFHRRTFPSPHLCLHPAGWCPWKHCLDQ